MGSDLAPCHFWSILWAKQINCPDPETRVRKETTPEHEEGLDNKEHGKQDCVNWPPTLNSNRWVVGILWVPRELENCSM